MPRRPVVFIPGFPASSLQESATGRRIFPPLAGDLVGVHRDRMINALLGPDDPGAPQAVVADGVIRGIGTGFFEISIQASSLFRILDGMGYREGQDLRTVPWDWRLPAWHPALRERVRSVVRQMAAVAGGPVAVLVHSTGGLVLRAALEVADTDAERARAATLARDIAHVVALGVPWAGTLKTLRHLGPGAGEAVFSAQEIRRVLARAWAAFDLMPPDPARTDLTDSQGNPLGLFTDVNGSPASPLVDRRWMRGDAGMLRRADASGRVLGARAKTFRVPAGAPPVPVTNLAGWGIATDTACQLDGGGIGMQFAPTEHGDGTVPFASAAWLHGPGVRTFPMALGLSEGFLPEPHSQMWDTPQSRDILRHVLTGAPLGDVVVSAAMDWDAVINRRPVVEIRVCVTDRDGRPLDGSIRFAPQVNQQPGRREVITGGRGSIGFVLPQMIPANRQQDCSLVVEWTGAGGPRSMTVRRSFDR